MSSDLTSLVADHGECYDADGYHGCDCGFACSAQEHPQHLTAVLLTSAADTVLAEARRICCGENPAPDHLARADHSERMAFAGRLAAAVRAS